MKCDETCLCVHLAVPQSLQRMVLDLGRDHFHLSGDALEELGRKVSDGNMEDVLKVYEAEMKVGGANLA